MCPTSFVHTKNRLDCALCGSGQLALISHTSCVTHAPACGEGNYAIYEIRQCYPCPSGTYCNLAHLICQPQTKLCDNGTYGNYNKRQCIWCPAGQIETTTRSTCSPCYTGSSPAYAIVNHTKCVYKPQDCDDASLANNITNQCEKCNEYEFSTYYHTACTIIPQDCEMMTVVNKTRMQCIMCDDGNVTNLFKNQCIPCQMNEYAPMNKTLFCLDDRRFCGLGVYGD